jgi:hypothetical protein
MTYRLVYFSNTSEAAFGHHDIEEILAASQRNNAAVGVTGALMFDEGYFVQVLEGAQDAIEETFERIQMDPRHHDVKIVDFSPIEKRTFDGWAMTYAGSRLPSEKRAMLADRGFDPASLSGQDLFNRVAKLVFATASA